MADGRRKLLSILLGLLGLFLFGVVKFAPLPHRPTPASIVLMLAAAGFLFLAARLMPGPEADSNDPGSVAHWAHGRIVLAAASILALLGYGLWTMFTGSP